MKVSRTVLAVCGAAAVLALAAPPLAAAPATAYGPTTATATLHQRVGESWRDLAAQATQKVRAEGGYFAHAQLVTAFGSAPDGPTTDMSQMTRWTFIYKPDPEDVPQGEKVNDVYIDGELGGELGEVTEGHGWWLGSMQIEGPRLTPADAYEKLTQAGQHDHAFEFIQLLRSTTPGVGQRYIFSNKPQQECDRWAVRDDTGEVMDMCEEHPNVER